MEKEGGHHREMDGSGVDRNGGVEIGAVTLRTPTAEYLKNTSTSQVITKTINKLTRAMFV